MTSFFLFFSHQTRLKYQPITREILLSVFRFREKTGGWEIEKLNCGEPTLE